MTNLSILAFWVLFGLLVGQGALVFGFVLALLRWKRSYPAGQPCPKTAVVLCLRGTDPFLPDCLEALLNQDYPRYDVRVVVDCREDPAWRTVEEVVRRRQATNVEIRPLTRRRDTCSLKCSSVLQAVSDLDDSYEVVALLDADTIPHPNWLRELVAPLADERVGASTGNRWYMPPDGALGTLIRYFWNAAAVVQMYWYGIAWGGTLALKTKVLRESDLLDRWGKAFCEDTMLYRALRKQGLRVVFVPSLMMVNRETCNIPSFFQWVRRQLLTARLYHPGWPAVVAHGIATSLALAAVIGLLVVALWAGRWEAAAWAGAGVALYLTALFLLLWPMEISVRRLVRARGEPTGWLTGRIAVRMPLAVPLTQVVYAAVLISTMLVRSVYWRGILYRVDGPWQIRMVRYRPYETGAPRCDDNVSL